MIRILLVIAFLGFVSCSDFTDNQSYCFIGDSEIARWDLQVYFPTWRTENLGRGGTGLTYIQQNEGCLKGKTAIVIFGTNDLAHISPSYVNDYIFAVSALQADVTCVVSIFPREFKNDPPDINEQIKELNDSISKRVYDKGWTYIDIYSNLLDGKGINKDYFSDGLHLNDFGYELLSYELKKKIR